MPHFIATSTILHDGETYEEGDKVEMTDRQAEPLLAAGRLNAAPAKKGEKQPEKQPE